MIQEDNKSCCRYSQYIGQQFKNPHDGSILNGDIITDDVIFRLNQDGFLNTDSGGEPAIDCPDGHVEFWESGQLHRISGLPAIIDNYGETLEFWEHGNQLEVKTIL